MQVFNRKWVIICILASYALSTNTTALSVHAANAFTLDYPISDREPEAHGKSDREQALALTELDSLAQPLAYPLHDWIAVDNQVLQDMRGGFTADNGLRVSFGIERAVSINGELVGATRFEFENNGKFIRSQNEVAVSNKDTVLLIQNGPGNTIDPAALSNVAAATIIQNSLSGQTIQSLTVINATSNSLGMLKNFNLQLTLQEALSNAAALR